MPKMYKPNRVTMYPNNDTIDPTIANTFSFTFNGETLSAYNYTFYDLFTGEPQLTNDIVLGTVLHNGEVVATSFDSTFFDLFQNAQLSYDVRVLGQGYTISSTIGSQIYTITGANYGFAETVFLFSDTMMGFQDVVLVPTSNPGDYYAFISIEAARNGLFADRIVCSNTGTETVKSSAWSEQIPFRTSQMPTMTLAPVTATSGSIDVIATYTHPDGYSLNRFNMVLYDISENVLMTTPDIYSSYPHYSFTNLASGEVYKIQFVGYSILEQFVDTGKVTMSVTYADLITSTEYTIIATNDCVNGRTNLTLQSTPLVLDLIKESWVSEFTIEGILIYRQEYGVTTPEIIATLPPQATTYHDYMAQSGKQYRYWFGFYGSITTESIPVIWPLGSYFVAPNGIVTEYALSDYYGWFLVDLDADKSYAFDVQFEGGDMTQEDDFAKYKTNLLYNSYSVGNIQALSSNMTGLISLSNLHADFALTNVLLSEIASLVSPRYHGRKIIKDRRTPTRIFPVFTYGFKQMPLHNGVGAQPYLCSFSWDQIADVIE